MTRHVGEPGAPPHRRRWGHLAAGWSLSFAGLHLYWGLGGSVGLAESAGAALADERPCWFVAVGLYGAALLLAAAGALGLALARRRPLTGRWARLLPLLGAGVATVLLARAIGIETLLLADGDYGAGAVSRSQRFWTLVLWNPWFLVGGVAFGLAALAAGRSGRPVDRSRRRRVP